MKRRGAQALREKLRDQSLEEERTYWRKRTQALQRRQSRARNAEKNKD